MKIDIPEGGEFPSGNWLICHGGVYGDYPKTEDYQGWYWVLKLPFWQWFGDQERWFTASWARRVLTIRHVWLDKGRCGVNGMGWQGWDWSLQWMRCDRDY